MQCIKTKESPVRTLKFKLILSGLTLIAGAHALASEMPPARQPGTARRRVPVDQDQQQPAQNNDCDPQYEDCGQGGPGPGAQFDPRSQYYCVPNGPCNGGGPVPVPGAVYPVDPPPAILPPITSVLPWGPPPAMVGVPLPIYRPGYVPPPYYGGGGRYYEPGYGHRPGYGHGGPRPLPYHGGRPGYRPMAYHVECKIESRNNGEVAVVSKDGSDLFVNASEHAYDLAQLWKAYYSQAGFEFCSDSQQAPAKQEIDI